MLFSLRHALPICSLLLIFVLTMGPADASAQATYQSGMVVLHPADATDEAVPDTLQGEILDREWTRTPTSITFRRNSEASATSYGVENLAGFSIGEQRYVRVQTRVDQRPTSIGQVYVPPEQSFETRTIFVRLIVDGPLRLYGYTDDRDHFYLDSENRDLEELIYYAQKVTRNGERYIATIRQYQGQLDAAKSDACIDVRTDRISFNLKRLARFVQTCNGDAGTIVDPNATGASGGVQFTHVVGVSGGLGSASHDFEDGSSATGINTGASYRLFLSGNRSFNPVSAFFGLRLSYLDFASIEETPTFDVPPLFRVQVEETTTQAVLLGLEVGTRARIRVGGVRPYLDISILGRYALTYDADIKRTILEFDDSNGSRELIRERDLGGRADPWEATQIGFRVGTGVEWNAWSVGVEGLRGVPASRPGRIQTPGFWQGALMVAYQL